MEEPKTTEQQKAQEKLQASAIMHAIETASNFQLYSYRVISHEAFLNRSIELAQQLLHATK